MRVSAVGRLKPDTPRPQFGEASRLIVVSVATQFRGGVTMTKSELIAHLADHFPQLVLKDAEYAVKMILDMMTEACLKGNRIEIRGFGSFDLRLRPARTGRNPKSGEKVHVPEKYVPHFKAGKELKSNIAAPRKSAPARRTDRPTTALEQDRG